MNNPDAPLEMYFAWLEVGHPRGYGDVWAGRVDGYRAALAWIADPPEYRQHLKRGRLLVARGDETPERVEAFGRVLAAGTKHSPPKIVTVGTDAARIDGVEVYGAEFGAPLVTDRADGRDLPDVIKALKRDWASVWNKTELWDEWGTELCAMIKIAIGSRVPASLMASAAVRAVRVAWEQTRLREPSGEAAMEFVEQVGLLDPSQARDAEWHADAVNRWYLSTHNPSWQCDMARATHSLLQASNFKRHTGTDARVAFEGGMINAVRRAQAALVSYFAAHDERGAPVPLDAQNLTTAGARARTVVSAAIREEIPLPTVLLCAMTRPK